MILNVRPTTVFLLAAILTAGCATKAVSPAEPNTVIVVPGIGGDGDVYAQIVRSLHDHGSDDCLRVSDWGSSFPVFFISISSQIWHKNVEHHLADQILLWRQRSSKFPNRPDRPQRGRWRRCGRIGKTPR